MRVLKNEYIEDWENNRSQEIKELTSKGIIPVKHDYESKMDAGEVITPEQVMRYVVLIAKCSLSLLLSLSTTEDESMKLVNSFI